MSRQITASVPLETQPDGQKKPLIGSGLFALWRAAILCEGGEENVKELIRTLRPHQDLEILRQELVYQESRKSFKLSCHPSTPSPLTTG